MLMPPPRVLTLRATIIPTSVQPRIRVLKSKGGKLIPSVYLPADTRKWKAALTDAALMQKPGAPWEGPVGIWVRGWWHLPKAYRRANGHPKAGVSVFKATKPDEDNVKKPAIDAMTAAGWWSDDSQIATAIMQKFWRLEKHDGFEVAAWPLTESWPSPEELFGDAQDA